MKGEQWVWLTDDPETWPDAQDGRSYYVWAYELGQLIDGGDDRYREKLAAGKMDEYYTLVVTKGRPSIWVRPGESWDPTEPWESTVEFYYEDLGCPEMLHVLAWKAVPRVAWPDPPEKEDA